MISTRRFVAYGLDTRKGSTSCKDYDACGASIAITQVALLPYTTFDKQQEFRASFDKRQELGALQPRAVINPVKSDKELAVMYNSIKVSTLSHI